MESESQLLWGVVFGAIGFGYFLYGKNQKALVPLLSGIALCVFPYFVSNTYLLLLFGVALLALPYFIKI